MLPLIGGNGWGEREREKWGSEDEGGDDGTEPSSRVVSIAHVLLSCAVEEAMNVPLVSRPPRCLYRLLLYYPTHEPLDLRSSSNGGVCVWIGKCVVCVRPNCVSAQQFIFSFLETYQKKS